MVYNWNQKKFDSIRFPSQPYIHAFPPSRLIFYRPPAFPFRPPILFRLAFFPNPIRSTVMRFSRRSPKQVHVVAIHPLSKSNEGQKSLRLCRDYTSPPLLCRFWSEGTASLYEHFSNMSGRGLLQPAFMCWPEVCKQDTLSRRGKKGITVNSKTENWATTSLSFVVVTLSVIWPVFFYVHYFSVVIGCF